MPGTGQAAGLTMNGQEDGLESGALERARAHPLPRLEEYVETHQRVCGHIHLLSRPHCRARVCLHWWHAWLARVKCRVHSSAL